MRGAVAAPDFTGIETEIMKALDAGSAWRPKSNAGIVEVQASFLRTLIDVQVSGNDLAPLFLAGDGRTRILGPIDWRGLAVPRDVILDGVEIAGPLCLDDAQLQSLILRNVSVAAGTRNSRNQFGLGDTELIPDTNRDKFKEIIGNHETLAAGRLVILGNLILDKLEGFVRLDLDDCEIGGSLTISDTKLPKGLGLRNAKVGGDLAFAMAKESARTEIAEGMVDLSGVKIGG
ncbi:MAG: hypothetical protein AAB227_11620, partial [Pseudomonadota bacterium]